MCVYVGSDVVLANLLYYSPNAEEGIDFTDIEEYCYRIKNAIINNSHRIKFISFQVNDYQLNYSLRSYPDYFKKFLGKYYKGIDLDIRCFENRVTPEMSTILRTVAEAM